MGGGLCAGVVEWAAGDAVFGVRTQSRRWKMWGSYKRLGAMQQRGMFPNLPRIFHGLDCTLEQIHFGAELPFQAPRSRSSTTFPLGKPHFLGELVLKRESFP